MSDAQQGTADEEPIIVVLEDPSTGSKVEYRVPPKVGVALRGFLDALAPSDRLQMAWDSGCRLGRST